jgi:hypothetical protein
MSYCGDLYRNPQRRGLVWMLAEIVLSGSDAGAVIKSFAISKGISMEGFSRKEPPKQEGLA